ncbi:MAG: hypothetical protein ACYSW4_05850 [Planctomycetota bacterium]|jgi:hypothetical protein
MSLPSEYVIEDAVRSIDDVIVYRANHPIHGKVNVYQPDDALPPDLARVVKKHLYQKGLQMRNLSLLNVPFTAKALEVSQNPNEPYVVTKYVKYSLEELISNGVTIKPKRMFAILSQVLDTTVNLAANGWVIDHVHPRQVKLPELLTGDISFTVIEGAEQQTDAAERQQTTTLAMQSRLKQMPKKTELSPHQSGLHKELTKRKHRMIRPPPAQHPATLTVLLRSTKTPV